MHDTATAIGYGFMAVAGCLAILALMGIVYGGALVYTNWWWKRLTRMYHVTVLWYWLDRLEKEGTHCFRKAGDDDQKPATPKEAAK